MTDHRAVRRIVQVHTRYREAGGEDAVVDAERQLLESAGIAVEQVLFDNAELREAVSPVRDLRLALDAVWSRSAERRVHRALRDSGAQVMHVHNTFAAASPSVFRAAFGLGIPVVQTLHNYRYVCPAATAFRDGRPCTDCVGRRVPWPGVLHACVRGSRRQSLVAAATSTFHRARGTYMKEVDRYLVLTNFQRQLLLDGGLPDAKVRVVPNFLGKDPGAGDGQREGVLFVGRLSVEKGIAPLIEAAKKIPGDITIVGGGPMRSLVEHAAGDGVVTYRGPLPKKGVWDALRRAVAVVCPSICFEGMPMVMLEAFATGTPLIASRIGSLAELVEDGVTGLLVDAGDPAQLAARMQWAVNHPGEMRAMGTNARSRYEARYRGSTHLAALMDVYESITHEARSVEHSA